MFFCVLIEYHFMCGVDLHTDIVPPPAPAKVPFAPHFVAAFLQHVLPASKAGNVRATWANGRLMQRGTDIQSLIPHAPLSPAVLLVPILTLFSGSKSHFGPRSVQANGTPVAVAIAVVFNYNLNCGDIPMPTGIVLAPNTVVAGMTLGDVLGGIFAMAMDAAIQAALNYAAAGMPGSPLLQGVVGALLGSPLGFSFNANEKGGPVNFFGRLAGAASDSARGYGEQLGDAIDRGLTAHDLSAPVDPAATISRPFSFAALDNPLAEQF